MSQATSLSQFLNYGGLGLLAILCVVVLGYNAWNLNALIAKGDPHRIEAARMLLLAQMGISLIGLLALAGGGIYLDGVRRDNARARMAEIMLDPWENGLDEKSRPVIHVSGTENITRPIKVICKPDEPATVTIDLEGFINHRIQEGNRNREILAPITAAALDH